MMFVRQERRNVQNLSRQGECLQKPVPRVGIPALEPVTFLTRALFAFHLFAVKAALEQKMVGEERTGGGKWANIFQPGHSFKKHRSDAVTCLLKTPLPSFSHGMDEAQNALSGHTRPLTVLPRLTLTFSLILQFSFPSSLSLAFQSSLMACLHVWMVLLV